MNNHVPDGRKKVHTAKSLAKYLGMKVFYEGAETPKGNYILESVSLSNIVRFKDNNGALIFLSKEGPQAYPILKTVDDLTEEDKQRYLSETVDFVSSIEERSLEVCFDWECTNCTEMQSFEVLTLDYANWLLKNNYGAVKKTSSPTGYVSIFDGLPCKSYAQVFGENND